MNKPFRISRHTILPLSNCTKIVQSILDSIPKNEEKSEKRRNCFRINGPTVLHWFSPEKSAEKSGL